MDVSVDVVGNTYEVGSAAWRDELSTLVDLLEEAGVGREEWREVPNTKGGVAEIIVALGTSGAITATYLAFRAWLGKAKNRRIRLTNKKTGDSVEIRGDELTEKAFIALARELMSGVGPTNG